MIWSDQKLYEWILHGGIDNFDPTCLNPASVDLRIDAQYRRPTPTGWGKLRDMSAEGVKMHPGDFFLFSTLEYTRIPDNAIAMLFLKSSTGRKGLEHLHAGYGDPGFHGQWTLEIVNHWPYPRRIAPGERLLQLVLMDCSPVKKTYETTGHYQNQRGATPYYEKEKKDEEKY